MGPQLCQPKLFHPDFFQFVISNITKFKIVIKSANLIPESNPLKKLYSVPVWINELDKEGLEAPAENSFKGGEALLCGIEAIQLDNQKSPGETAFYLKQLNTMILGDALLGNVPGKLNMLPPDKYADQAKAKAGLKKLLDYDFETLLVGDGTSILKNAKETVASFLAT